MASVTAATDELAIIELDDLGIEDELASIELDDLGIEEELAIIELDDLEIEEELADVIALEEEIIGVLDGGATEELEMAALDDFVGVGGVGLPPLPHADNTAALTNVIPSFVNVWARDIRCFLIK